MAITIDDGGLETQDPNDQRVYVFDWDVKNLGASVQLTGAGTFTMSVVTGDNTTPLTKDQESLLTGNRKTQVRLAGGTLGTLYKIDNQVVTNESPAQTKNRHFLLKVEDR